MLSGWSSGMISATSSVRAFRELRLTSSSYSFPYCSPFWSLEARFLVFTLSDIYALLRFGRFQHIVLFLYQHNTQHIYVHRRAGGVLPFKYSNSSNYSWIPESSL